MLEKIQFHGKVKHNQRLVCITGTQRFLKQVLWFMSELIFLTTLSLAPVNKQAIVKRKQMAEYSSKLGYIGIGIGAIALMLALVHFWAGPFSPQPSLEQTVAEKAVAIKNATISALKGDKVDSPKKTIVWDTDRIITIVIPTLGGLAIIFGVLGFAKKESWRAAAGAAILGGFAVAFQFVTYAIGAIIVVILIAVVLSQIGIS